MKHIALIACLVSACQGSDPGSSDAPPGADAPAGVDASTADGAPADGAPDAAAPDARPCIATPAWVAFVVRDPDSAENLRAVRVDGTSPGVPQPVNPALSSLSRLYGYAWAPDGNRLIYFADADARSRREAWVVTVADAGIGAAQKVNGYLADGVSVTGLWWSPASDRAAYLSDRLFAVDLSGAVPAEPVQVSPEPTTYGQFVSGDPLWAPDGTTLAYVWQDGATVQVLVADSGTGTIRTVNEPLASGEGAGQPAWRPGGGLLAFIHSHGVDDTEVMIANVTVGVPGTPVAITASADWQSGLRWSPDGTRLAFVGQEVLGPDDRRTHLYVAEIGVPPYTATSVSGAHEVWSFEWAPDSSAILFETTGASGHDLFAVPADGSSAPVGVAAFPDPSCNFTRWGWSPTLPQAWYLAYDCVGPDLYVADLRAWPPGPARRVSPGLGADRAIQEGVAWAPDGRALVYVADQDADEQYEAFLIAFDDGVPRAPVQLHPTLAPLDPGSGDVWETAWAADARRVLYTADQAVATHVEAHVVEVVDGVPGAPRVASGTILAGSRVFDVSWQPGHGGCAP